MKIGIDAKWLFRGPVSGRIFTQNVLPELFSLYPEHEWHIFLNRKDRKLAFPFQADNIHIHYIWAGLNLFSNLFILPRHAKRYRLDAVLFQTFTPKGRKFKSIAFIHDVLFRDHPAFFSWKERLYFKPLQWTAPSARRIITTTQFVKKELLKFHYSKNETTIDIAPLGVSSSFKPLNQHDPNLLRQVKEKYQLPGLYLLFAGRLNARKNIGALISSLHLLNDKNISLVITGEKDWKIPQLRHLLKEKKMNSRIIFTGSAPDDELTAIYAMAKIFCFPSFAEGFGLPPLEAMASGIPVVVSKTTAMPEVCGDAAIFINPGSPEEIAGKINELMINEPLCGQLIKKGLERAAGFTWKKTAEAIMKSIHAATE